MTATLVYGGLTLTGGAPYEILLAGADLGNPKPVTTAVRSLFLDGSVVTGRFSDNRTIAFQVLIKASTATATTAALDALASQVDAATNTITWTPDTGLPQAFDTFRGELHEDFSWQGRSSTQRLVMVSMPALPFGRTPTTSTLTASATTSVQIQAFTTATGTWTGYAHNSSGTLVVDNPTVSTVSGLATNLPTTTSLSGQNDYIGTGQAYWSGTGTIASTSITGRTLVGLWILEQDAMSNGFSTLDYLSLTLSSSGGSSTWRLSSPVKLTGTYAAQQVFFDLTATPYSTTGSGYSAGAVTGWTIRGDFTALVNNYGIAVQLYNLTAYSPGYGSSVSADAGSYAMGPVLGSARTAMDLRVDRGGTNTVKDLLVYQAPVEAVPGYQPLLVGSSPYTTPTVNISGTFDIIASIAAAAQSTAQSVAVSIQQTQGGSNVGTAWTSGTVTTTAGNAYAMLGQVTLPLVGTAVPNAGVAYVVTVTTGAAVVLDMFMLDTRGALVLIGPTPLGTAVKYLFIASPQPATGVGGVFSGSTSTLSDATSVLALSRLSGGQMAFNPGANTLVVCSTQASSDLVVTATYSPRWLTERTA